jgi:hypothetical protein
MIDVNSRQEMQSDRIENALVPPGDRLPYGVSREQISVADEAVHELPGILGTSDLEVTPAWYLDEWSMTLLVRSADGNRWFLKGTPRSRSEADVLGILYSLSSQSIPRLVALDILPGCETRWFVLEDAGQVSQAGTAGIGSVLQAVSALGELQKRAEGNSDLRAMLPNCEAHGLRNAAVTVGRWICDASTGEENRLAVEYTRILQDSVVFFDRLGSVLSATPSTCVHGDFWSGNWGVLNGAVRIFDWGDAIWGVGGLSVTSLLGQQKEVTAHADQIWCTYGDAIEHDLSSEYRDMCALASDIAYLVIYMGINRCCRQPVSSFGAILETMKRLCHHARNIEN